MIYNWELYKPASRVYIWLELPGREVIKPAVQTKHDETGFWLKYKYEGKVYEAYYPSHEVTKHIWARPLVRLVHGSGLCCDIKTGEAKGQGGAWNEACRVRVAENTIKHINGKSGSINILKIGLLIGAAAIAYYVIQSGSLNTAIPGA